ncbi:hypothetical protein [Wenjunlia tyrosinilytica]|uniref:Uncharacterized protein n=1 Tax=Wenjunlia tyrosinilytica TaxID=1544741 RepID=A0A917ZJU1_9ACTN|nr:hypothetical protein [Wenjunlia tyrosinilytica]GGO83117.1 hypothetical protein GCM10012280_11310 [Wenjunlia tyrosinilytica]
MSEESAPRFARLQVELVVEITDPDELASAALAEVASDEYMTDEERRHAVSAIKEDDTEALAYLIDPFDLLNTVPGIELAQASWQCSKADYDPDSEDWALGEDEGDGDEGDGDEGDGREVR